MHRDQGLSNGLDPDTSSSATDYERDYREGAWGERRILCLDGGGIRGYWSLLVLHELMKVVKDLERSHRRPAQSSTASPLFRTISTQNGSQETLSPTIMYRPCHYFDYICGVSMGGIAAVLLGFMRFSVEEAIDRCEKILVDLKGPNLIKSTLSLGRTTHSRTRQNSRILMRNLRDQLEETTFGPDAEQGLDKKALPESQYTPFETDENMCQTIVYATQQFGKGMTQPYVFRSYPTNGFAVRNWQSDTRKFPLVDVCRALIAAPMYFEGVEIGEYGPFRDGGISDVDLAGEVYDEMYDMGNNVDSLLSIGSVFRPELSHGQTANATSDTFLEREATRHDFKFGRFADPLVLEGLSDDPEKAFRQVRTRALGYCQRLDVKEGLNNWAHRLVKGRRRRAKTGEWNRFVGLRLSYCPICSQNMQSTGYPIGVDTMSEHIRDAHPPQIIQ